MTLQEQIDAIVDAANFGRASAAKRGRNPRWPYVPIIDSKLPRQRTEQIRGLAFETRAEAVASAQRTIDARREHMRTLLADPRYRAWRRQYGLPEEIAP